MLEMGLRGSVSGLALIRAAEAMLQALGGAELCMLFPSATATDDPALQLGLSAPEVEEVRLRPAAVRNLGRKPGEVETRLEFLVPASAVQGKVEARQSTSAKAFFEAALGIVHEGRLLRIESAEPDFFAGTAYLFRITAVE
jgi:hypothetical protein